MSVWKSLVLKSSNLNTTKTLLNVRWCHHEPEMSYKECIRKRIGNREVVGFGQNGIPSYMDMHVWPFPAIRFREFGPDLMALREKEKGDWRNLSIDEKKCLYRASFCSTFAEMDAPDPQWKATIGWTMFFLSLGMWLFAYTQMFIRKEAPPSFSRESRIAQYYRAVALNHKPFVHNIRPPGAEKRVHPKNRAMLEEIMKKEAEKKQEEN